MNPDLNDIQNDLSVLGVKMLATQKQLHKLLSLLVIARQRLRTDGRYEEADNIRKLLYSVGIEVREGTYNAFGDIPDKSKGIRGDDHYVQKFKPHQLLEFLDP